MSVRILHCSENRRNYYLCIKERVAGFIQRGAALGDLVYLAVRVDGETYCGARGTLTEITEFRPWDDAELYKHCLRMENMEFCEPFQLKTVLSSIGGKNWVLKYIQVAKTIQDEEAISALNRAFAEKKRDQMVLFPGDSDIEHVNRREEQTRDPEEKSDEEIDKKVLDEVPDVRIDISGTYLTINFANETHPIRGLEALVNGNFYPLFSEFPEDRTVLIPKNRLFLTKGLKQNGILLPGIRSIPDALLVVYSKKTTPAFQINLIEYECYGEKRIKLVDKTNYFNGQIIPQLMKFASTFSIVTDSKIRDETIKEWVNKVIEFIYGDNKQREKVSSWIKVLDPSVHVERIAEQLKRFLEEAFRTNLRIVLIIDELSTEQKDTMNNVISAFKLGNGQGIQFKGFVVRLEQKINVADGQTEYAISVQ